MSPVMFHCVASSLNYKVSFLYCFFPSTLVTFSAYGHMVKIFLVNKNVLLDLSYMFLLRIYKEEM